MLRFSLIVALLAIVLIEVRGQATTCTTGVSCGKGTNWYIQRSLTYDSTTGKFTGSITSNQCPNYGTPATSECITSKINDGTYPTTKATTRVTRAGYGINTGIAYMNVLEAGFAAGTFCTNQTSRVGSGWDLDMLLAYIQYICPSSSYATSSTLLGSCGGHSTPYHMHHDPICDYSTATAGPTGHSSLVAVYLDGRGLYGAYESTGVYAYPLLDACNGHYGNTPAFTTSASGVSPAMTIPAATNVYHYHSSPIQPHLPGCFGPVASLSAAAAMITTCDTTKYPPSSICTSLGSMTYQTDCPLYHHVNGSWANQFKSTSACPCTSKTVMGGCAALKSLTFGNSFIEADAAVAVEMEVEEELE